MKYKTYWTFNIWLTLSHYFTVNATPYITKKTVNVKHYVTHLPDLSGIVFYTNFKKNKGDWSPRPVLVHPSFPTFYHRLGTCSVHLRLNMFSQTRDNIFVLWVLLHNIRLFCLVVVSSDVNRIGVRYESHSQEQRRLTQLWVGMILSNSHSWWRSNPMSFR